MKTINKTVLSVMLITFLTINTETFAQVGIGTTDPDASSMLDIQSNAKGVLIPRMLTTERNAIATPANGLLVFDTTTNSFWFRDGSLWKELTSGGKLVDVDGDTKVEVEKNPDEDIIRFTTAGTEYMQIGSDGVMKLGNRDTSTDTPAEQNYTKITADGSLSYVGNATRWDDLKVPVNAVKVNNVTDPAYWGSFIGNTALLWFKHKASDENDVVFTVQMPHAWKEGTDIFPHVHWTSKGTAPGNNRVTWGLEYTWINVGGEFPVSITITGTTVATPNVGSIALYEHVITPIGTGGIVGAGKTLSSMLVCRLFRNSSNVLDTYAHDAGLLEIDFHFQIDSDGSNQEYTKE